MLMILNIVCLTNNPNELPETIKQVESIITQRVSSREAEYNHGSEVIIIQLITNEQWDSL